MSESDGLTCLELFFYDVVGWIFNDIWFHGSVPICVGVLPILLKFLGLKIFFPFQNFIWLVD